MSSSELCCREHGTQCTNELFRRALGMIVGRSVVATVAQQDDYMKRIRKNGGARTALKHEGIIILGQYNSHVIIAHALGVPVPGPGESVSVRIAPAHFPVLVLHISAVRSGGLQLQRTLSSPPLICRKHRYACISRECACPIRRPMVDHQDMAWDRA